MGLIIGLKPRTLCMRGKHSAGWGISTGFFLKKLLHLCVCQCQGKSQESSSPMSIPCVKLRLSVLAPSYLFHSVLVFETVSECLRPSPQYWIVGLYHHHTDKSTSIFCFGEKFLEVHCLFFAYCLLHVVPSHNVSDFTEYQCQKSHVIT